MSLRRIAAVLTLAAGAATAAQAADVQPRPYEPRPVAVPKNASYVLPDGSIYIVGNDGMKDMLTQFNTLFAKTHPGFRFTMLLEGSSTGIGGLTAGVSAFAPMGREAWPTDLGGFREYNGYLPDDIHIGHAGYLRPNQKNPPAIYVNAKNPLAGLSLEQVARIFTRGAGNGDIAHWNALGLGGEWAQRAIHVYGARDDGGLPTSMRVSLLGGRQFARSYEPLANFAAVVKAVADDPYGIGMAGWVNTDALGAKVKLVPLAAKDGMPYATPTYDNVQAGKYPFSPYLRFYVNRKPGTPLDPFVREYARMVLSSEGQAIIAAAKDGEEPYLPLNAAEVAEQLARLEQPAAPADPVAAASLRLLGRTELPSYRGDFDHFAVDLKGQRLFLAGEDQGTLEVFDLRDGRHLRSVPGFEAPHAIHFMPDRQRLLVTDSGAGMSRIVDATSLRIVGTLPLAPGADAMRYDPSRRHLWVVTGGKNASPKRADSVVSEIDPDSGAHLGDVAFDTDFTEAIAVEEKGDRLFVNLTGRNEIAVLDKRTRKRLATWPVAGGAQNAAMAFDEDKQRLFVVTRKPFRLLVIDARNGAAVASFDAPQRTNDIQWDAANHRLYLTGDDHVAVFRQADADRYDEIARVPSAPGAKTAILVPEIARLFVAVSPGDKPGGGALLSYAVLPAPAANPAL